MHRRRSVLLGGFARRARRALAAGFMLAANLVLAAGAALAGQPVVDANTATRSELDAVTGIGPALAQRIVSERQNGPFRSLADLQARVRGVGEANLRKMRDSGLVVGRPVSGHGTETIVGGLSAKAAPGASKASRAGSPGR